VLHMKESSITFPFAVKLRDIPGLGNHRRHSLACNFAYMALTCAECQVLRDDMAPGACSSPPRARAWSTCSTASTPLPEQSSACHVQPAQRAEQ
jgi:hypothetical protein